MNLTLRYPSDTQWSKAYSNSHLIEYMAGYTLGSNHKSWYPSVKEARKPKPMYYYHLSYVNEFTEALRHDMNADDYYDLIGAEVTFDPVIPRCCGLDEIEEHRRLCVAPSIAHALCALDFDEGFVVFRTVNKITPQPAYSVADAFITQERWLRRRTRMKVVGFANEDRASILYKNSSRLRIAGSTSPACIINSGSEMLRLIKSRLTKHALMDIFNDNEEEITQMKSQLKTRFYTASKLKIMEW